MYRFPNFSMIELRYLCEFNDLCDKRFYHFVVRPTCDNMVYTTFIRLSKHSPYRNRWIKLTIHIDNEYPSVPPTIRFVSKIFHPNVAMDGSLCDDFICHYWNHYSKMEDFLNEIIRLLDVPNMDYTANELAAEFYQQSREVYNNFAKAIARNYLRISDIDRREYLRKSLLTFRCFCPKMPKMLSSLISNFLRK